MKWEVFSIRPSRPTGAVVVVTFKCGEETYDDSFPSDRPATVINAAIDRKLEQLNGPNKAVERVTELEELRAQ